MEGSKRKQMPKFGNWDFYDDIPLSGGYFHKDADLFKMPQASLPHHYTHKSTKTEEKRRKQEHQEQKKQVRTCDPTSQQQQKQRRHRTLKAVDEDLYKVPPEFLYQKPKRERKVVCDFLRRCIGLSSIE